MSRSILFMCTIFSTDAGFSWRSGLSQPHHCHQEWHHAPCPSFPPPLSSPKPRFTQTGAHPPLCWLLGLSGCPGSWNDWNPFAFLRGEFSARSQLLVCSEKRWSPAAAGPSHLGRWGRIWPSYFSCSQLATDLAVSRLYVFNKIT